MDANIHIQRHTKAQIEAQRHFHTQLHVLTYIGKHTDIFTETHPYTIHTQSSPYLNTYLSTHIHSHKHISTYIYAIYTHIFICNPVFHLHSQIYTGVCQHIDTCIHRHIQCKFTHSLHTSPLAQVRDLQD